MSGISTYLLSPTVKTLALNSTYLLVSHGSRDPRPQVALGQLAQGLEKRLAARVSASSNFSGEASFGMPLVGVGTLELGPTSLDAQIKQFSEQTLSIGLTHIQLLPLFLLPGIHVKEDIPAAVNQAQQSIGPNVRIELRPHLGTHPGMSHLIANQMADSSVEAWILLAHGSRRWGGNRPIEAMANQLQAVPAYWSIAPSLETRVTELVTAGCQRIGIMPYFLFSGSTTDAIAQEVARLNQEFPQQLKLTTPLEPGEELIDLILDLTQLPVHLKPTHLLRSV